MSPLFIFLAGLGIGVCAGIFLAVQEVESTNEKEVIKQAEKFFYTRDLEASNALERYFETQKSRKKR